MAEQMSFETISELQTKRKNHSATTLSKCGASPQNKSPCDNLNKGVLIVLKFYNVDILNAI